MPTLRVDLRGGWSDDGVRVTVDGVEVLQRDAVTTNWSVGLADSVAHEVDPGPHEVEVSATSRGTSARRRVEVAEDMHVGVDLEDGSPRIEEEREPPIRY